MLKRNVFNKLLILKLIKMAEVGVNGATRIQKLVFESEKRSRQQKIPMFNYKFIRWHYGPYSEELKEDIDFLIEKDLIIKEPGKNVFKIAPKGEETIGKAEGIFNKLGVSKSFKEVLDEYKETPLNKLLNEIYDKHKITEFKMGETIEPIKE